MRVSDTESHGVKRADRRGVTLVEGVVALFLFAMTVACACEVILVTRRTCDRARARYTAVNMAKNRLEHVLAFNYHVVEFLEVDNIVVDRNGAPDAEGDYRISTVVMEVAPSLKQVTIRVDIRNHRTMDFDGETQKLSSYVSRFGKPLENA